jgi:hypothetical protein
MDKYHGMQWYEIKDQLQGSDQQLKLHLKSAGAIYIAIASKAIQVLVAPYVSPIDGTAPGIPPAQWFSSLCFVNKSTMYISVLASANRQCWAQLTAAADEYFTASGVDRLSAKYWVLQARQHPTILTK